MAGSSFVMEGRLWVRVGAMSGWERAVVVYVLDCYFRFLSELGQKVIGRE